jgi:hypothetical protein
MVSPAAQGELISKKDVESTIYRVMRAHECTNSVASSKLCGLLQAAIRDLPAARPAPDLEAVARKAADELHQHGYLITEPFGEWAAREYAYTIILETLKGAQ